MTGFKSKKAMANDKIAELIKEATATAWIDRVANGPVPIYAEEHMVKLAELIIQECLNICEDMGDNCKDGHYCADKIAKTFWS